MSKQIRLEFTFVVEDDNEKNKLLENYLNGTLSSILYKALKNNFISNEDILLKLTQEIDELKKSLLTSTSIKDATKNIAKPFVPVSETNSPLPQTQSCSGKRSLLSRSVLQRK